MPHIEVTRRVAADPAGVALLLAEPQPWVGPDQSWAIEAPQRIADGFAAAIQVSDPIGRLAIGSVTVRPAVGPGCHIRLEVQTQSRAVARLLKKSAESFLDALAERAQARSFAA